MIEYFADLHIHIGRTSRGEAVKVTASANLTFNRILQESAERKGIEAIAIVDCSSVGVLRDLEAMLASEEMVTQAGGGLMYRDRLVLYPAAEIGVSAGRGESHYVSYFPDYESARRFSDGLSPFLTNQQLSSQKARMSSSDLLQLTEDCGGFLVPAHVFTPHKGYYGNCGDRLSDVFSAQECALMPAVELGLSADTQMAARISELDSKSFLSNSDAHSLSKIAREYNRIRAEDMSFKALKRALQGERGGVLANYGLDPRLGKYHRTFCTRCEAQVPLSPHRRCRRCGLERLVVGVADRLGEVADRPEGHQPKGRPPYIRQVPLEFVPGVGPRTLDRLIEVFGSEMNVLHRATEAQLRQVVRAEAAQRIRQAGSGNLVIAAGGGGTYGKVIKETTSS